jgi:glycosyltransferase involved in cell wall biosynthesis
MSPTISIVMPVYQVEDYIANSLRSVVNQTFSSFEVVLVNDGSKDKSIDIAKSILENAKVKYTLVNQTNKGCAAARNAGIRNSEGDWIVCVDPDDIVASDFLERLYDACIKYKTDVSFCSWQPVDSKNVFKESARNSKDLEIGRDEILLSFLKRKIRVIMPGLLIKKELLENNNLQFDESIIYGDDQPFIWRVFVAATSVAYVKDKLYNYLRRTNSIMTSSDIDDVVTGYLGVQKLQTEITDNNIVKKYILPRWVFGALNASTHMMNFDNFSELAKRLEYKKYMKQLLSFPDLRVSILSYLILVDLRLFYRIGNLL